MKTTIWVTNSRTREMAMTKVWLIFSLCVVAILFSQPTEALFRLAPANADYGDLQSVKRWIDFKRRAWSDFKRKAAFGYPEDRPEYE
ncbi:hypothetical protein CRM22_005632 [Opisthorchis felineus]|uniref:Uncharacterized protein n=1 Tax=Opisthorchis felineus TaxID=147828 RepID=A0A4S2LW59_OPIFE|nr:hypothetical protein CRM22_005632 [Opisthorchis felineus]